jgi:SOS-response transcriptional repressor LexA
MFTFCFVGRFLPFSNVYSQSNRYEYMGFRVTDYKTKQFSERLNKALDLRGYPPFGRGRVNYIQEIFNLSRSGANKWLHGKCIPHPKTRKLIAEKLGISLFWLERGEGEPTTPNPEPYRAKNQVCEIPLFTLAEAYDLKKALCNLSRSHMAEKVIISQQLSESCFAVKLVGKAMLPKFDSESILIVDPNQEITDGDFVIAKSSRLPEVLFRQLILGSDGKYLIALNPKFQTIKINDKSEILGKVIETRTPL